MKNKFHIKDKYHIFAIALIIIVISFGYVINIINILEDLSTGSKNVAYITNVEDSLNYDVHIKPNPYIEENILTRDNSYITELVDKIVFTFNYKYLTDRDVKLSYSYLIVGTIVSNSSTDSALKVMNPIWVKDYILLPESKIVTSNGMVNISETIDLSLIAYNDLVNNFINDYTILVTSNLEVKLIVKINSDIDGKIINNEHILMASVPLGVKVFDITTSKNFQPTEIIYINQPIKKETGYMKIIIYITVNLISIVLGYYFIKKIIHKYRDKYIMIRNKILRQYGDKIVEVTDFTGFKDWEIVEVFNFEELLNLSNEIFEPIFCYEREVNNNLESWFCVIKGQVVYRYILRENENK